MSQNDPRTRRDRRKVIAVVAGATALIATSFGVQAVADSRVAQHAKLFVTEGTTSMNPFTHKAGWGGGWRRGGRSHWSDLSDAEIEKRVNRAVRHIAIEIDANDEQTAKITALVTEVAKDMRPVRDNFRAAGERMRELLTAATIDREAIERVRTERLAEIDERTRQVTNALADVAEVLTPEQRATVQQRIEDFRSMRRHWRRG